MSELINEEAEDEWLGRQPTLPPDCAITFKGFADDDAKRLHETIGQIIYALSHIFDLERLDGVTVAFDYPSALANLDRGTGSPSTLKPTTENGQGVAMAPSVIRDGTVKAHIVLDARVAFLLEKGQDDDDDWKVAFGLIAHECAHVQLIKDIHHALPDLASRRSTDITDEFTWGVAVACWDEYGACRLSADFGEHQLKWYEDLFIAALSNARERANDFIRAYRLHADIHRLLAEVGPIYKQLITFAGYLIGHIDGFSKNPAEAIHAQEALQGHWFAPHYIELAVAFRALWERYGKWASLHEFDHLKTIALNVMRDGGIEFRRMDNGQTYIDVPLTPSTTPAI